MFVHYIQFQLECGMNAINTFIIELLCVLDFLIGLAHHLSIQFIHLVIITFFAALTTTLNFLSIQNPMLVIKNVEYSEEFFKE